MNIPDEVRKMMYNSIFEAKVELVETMLKMGGADEVVLKFTRKLIKHGCPPSTIIATLQDYAEDKTDG